MIAAVLGVGVIGALAPTLVSGSARTTVGSGAAAVAAAKPYLADLSGANEVPPADPDGRGTAAVTIDVATGEICVDMRVSNITTAVAAHIHRGAAGVNGPVVVPLTAPNTTSAQCVTASPVPLAAEIAANPGGFYVNVHTADYPNGAIRGQLSASSVVTGTTQILSQPLRAYDSRTTAEGILPPNTTRVVGLDHGKAGDGTSQIAVPPGATAAMIRVTVTQTGAAGYLKVYSNALSTEPATSNVNWSGPNSDTGADMTVAIDAEARIKVTSGGQQTHFVIDVVGYLF